MKDKYNETNNGKKAVALIAIFAIAVILLCFVYSLIVLIIQPSDIFIVENGKIYEEESTVRIYN